MDRYSRCGHRLVWVIFYSLQYNIIAFFGASSASCRTLFRLIRYGRSKFVYNVTITVFKWRNTVLSFRAKSPCMINKIIINTWKFWYCNRPRTIQLLREAAEMRNLKTKKIFSRVIYTLPIHKSVYNLAKPTKIITFRKQGSVCDHKGYCSKFL